MVQALVDADDCVMIDNLATGFDGAIAQEASLVIWRPAHRRVDNGAPRCSNGYDCWGKSAALERAAASIHLIRSDSHAPLSQWFRRVEISLEHREKWAQADGEHSTRQPLKELDLLGSFCQNPGLQPIGVNRYSATSSGWVHCSAAGFASSRARITSLRCNMQVIVATYGQHYLAG